MSVVLARQADPYSLAGSELDTIAAVVLGGASIAGGYGSVFGTVLGVFLIALIRDNLILLGISGSWERAAVGALLIIGIVTQAFIRKMKKRETQESHAEVQK
jgi:simple sugar transport system permease protein